MEGVHDLNQTVNIRCEIHCENCCPRWLRGFSCFCPVTEVEEPRELKIEEARVVEESKDIAEIREKNIEEKGKDNAESNRGRTLKHRIKHYKPFWKKKHG